MIFGDINPSLWIEEVARNKAKLKTAKNPLEMSSVDVFV